MIIESVNISLAGQSLTVTVEELKGLQEELNELFPKQSPMPFTPNVPYPRNPTDRMPFAPATPYAPTPPYDTGPPFISPSSSPYTTNYSTTKIDAFDTTNNVTLKQKINPVDHPNLFDRRGNMKLADTIDSSKIGLHPNHPDYKEPQ